MCVCYVFNACFVLCESSPFADYSALVGRVIGKSYVFSAFCRSYYGCSLAEVGCGSDHLILID